MERELSSEGRDYIVGEDSQDVGRVILSLIRASRARLYQANTYPWIVSLRKMTGETLRHYCGGSLIASKARPDWI